MLDVRLRSSRHAADSIHFDRRIAPTEHGEAFFARGLLEQAFAGEPLLPLDRQKAHRNAVFARSGQAEPEMRGFFREKFVRNLNQNARAVACLGVATAGAPMLEIYQDFQTFAHDFARGFTFDVHDETDAAGIMLMSGIVQTLGRR